MSDTRQADIGTLKKQFWIATALLLLAALACSGQIRTRRQLEKSRDDLIRAESGLARLRAASAERRKEVAAFNLQHAQNDAKISPERFLYQTIDDLNAAIDG